MQMETVKIRQKFWKKFRRIMPATRAARFYQLENKMDTEIDFVLAGAFRWSRTARAAIERRKR